MYKVEPLPHYKHLQPYKFVIYNGFKEPMAVVANPEDIWFCIHECNACCWMIPEAGYDQ